MSQNLDNYHQVKERKIKSIKAKLHDVAKEIHRLQRIQNEYLDELKDYQFDHLKDHYISGRMGGE